MGVREVIAGLLLVSLAFPLKLEGQLTSYVKDELIAQFNKNVGIEKGNGQLKLRDTDDWQLLKDSFHLESIESLSSGKHEDSRAKTLELSSTLYLLKFTDTIKVKEYVEKLNSSDIFLFVEPNYYGKGGGSSNICEQKPNDEFFDRQWPKNPTAAANIGIKINHGWSLTTGDTSVLVAILDSGIKPGHLEFQNRIWHNKDELDNGLDSDLNGYVDDTSGWNFTGGNNNLADETGHGTHVTGILAANGNNGIGYAGMDWQCQLLPLKVLGENNRGKFSWWIKAINYAIDQGADVINMSLGSAKRSLGLRITLDKARDAGIPVVASMMNENTDNPFYPAAYENTIAVGATDSLNNRANPFYGSNTKGSNYGPHIDLVAPGNKVYGLSHKSDTNYSVVYSGTSMAAPFVTGTISLMLGLDPLMPVDSVERYLERGATDQVGNQNDTQGWDPYYGHGLLNSYYSLLLAKSEKKLACKAYTVPSNDETYRTSGLYPDTLLSKKGCDSVFLMQTIIGDTSSKVTNVTECDSFVLSSDNRTLTTSGTYYDSLTNQFGCDSIVTVQLTIPEFNARIKPVNDTTLGLYDLETDGQIRWVNCDSGFKPVKTKGNGKNKFSPNFSGYYAAVINKQGCYDTTKCQELKLITGAAKKRIQNKVEVFPNPFSNRFHINNHLNSLIEYELVSASGKLVKTGGVEKHKRKEVGMSQDAGVYFLRIKGRKGLENYRMLAK